MAPEHIEFLQIATALLERTDCEKVDFHEIAESMQIRLQDAFHIVKLLVSTGHAEYHPTGGFTVTGKRVTDD